MFYLTRDFKNLVTAFAIFPVVSDEKATEELTSDWRKPNEVSVTLPKANSVTPSNLLYLIWYCLLRPSLPHVQLREGVWKDLQYFGLYFFFLGDLSSSTSYKKLKCNGATLSLQELIIYFLHACKCCSCSSQETKLRSLDTFFL